MPATNRKSRCGPDACGPDTSDAVDVLSVPGAMIDDGELSRLCKALGHPIRIRILRILRARESCVCGELVEELPLAQSTISQHLKVLKDAGLVIGEIDGPRRCYCIAPDALARLQRGLLDL